MKFSCIELKRKKENIVYVNNGRVIATVSIHPTMEETLFDKGILEN
jgi:hypothetical protein